MTNAEIHLTESLSPIQFFADHPIVFGHFGHSVLSYLQHPTFFLLFNCVRFILIEIDLLDAFDLSSKFASKWIEITRIVKNTISGENSVYALYNLKKGLKKVEIATTDRKTNMHNFHSFPLYFLVADLFDKQLTDFKIFTILHSWNVFHSKIKWENYFYSKIHHINLSFSFLSLSLSRNLSLICCEWIRFIRVCCIGVLLFVFASKLKQKLSI